MVAAAVGAATLVAGVYSANKQSSAASDAAGAQSASAQQGIDAQNARFAQVQQLLSPYVNRGNQAGSMQGDLTGLNGNGPQAAAIAALQQSPLYTSQLQAGQNSILQNASATGGLRGGNTQAALAQFSPALLAATINDQYNKLGGITSLGQNAAAGVGNAGMANGSSVAALLQQQGAAQAGGALAGGRADAGYANALTGALGIYGSLGGFGSTGTRTGASPAGNGAYNVSTMQDPSPLLGLNDGRGF